MKFDAYKMDFFYDDEVERFIQYCKDNEVAPEDVQEAAENFGLRELTENEIDYFCNAMGWRKKAWDED